jgi:hypothetical protein
MYPTRFLAFDLDLHVRCPESYILSFLLRDTAVAVGSTGNSHHVSIISTDSTLETDDAELFDPVESRGEEVDVVEDDLTDLVELREDMGSGLDIRTRPGEGRSCWKVGGRESVRLEGDIGRGGEYSEWSDIPLFGDDVGVSFERMGFVKWRTNSRGAGFAFLGLEIVVSNFVGWDLGLVGGEYITGKLADREGAVARTVYRSDCCDCDLRIGSVVEYFRNLSLSALPSSFGLRCNNAFGGGK